jgi:pimeloyl-ACP methyl ester carboxylesterase
MSRQRVVRFGETTPLTGVLTEPPAGATRAAVGVLILDSGILHHVGANRLHVQLARRLAELGFPSLRFDFSGIGDSEPRRDGLSFEDSAPKETVDAIDYMVRSNGVAKVVLMGLCSGADVAHMTALADQRVIGLGLLDPWAYRTLMYHIHYYVHRLIRPSAYARWLQIRLGRARDFVRRARSSDARNPDMYEMPEYIRVSPPRERVASDLSEFVRRGIRLSFIFSGGLEEYNHLGQYRSSFRDVDFRGLLRESHVSDATHVFSALDHQKVVVRELSDWVAVTF